MHSKLYVAKQKHKAQFGPPSTIDDIVSRFHGCIYRSSLDLRDAYWLTPMAPGSGEKAAFVTHRGQYSMTRAMFGLKNSGAYYCQNMDSCIDQVRHLGIQNYVDDTAVANREWNDHLTVLDGGFAMFETEGIAGNFSKTSFCKQKMLQ